MKLKETTLIKTLVTILIILSLIFLIVTTDFIIDYKNIISLENWRVINFGQATLNLAIVSVSGSILYLIFKRRKKLGNSIYTRWLLGVIVFFGIGIFMVFVSTKDLLEGESYYTGSCEIFTETAPRSITTLYKVKFSVDGKETIIRTSEDRFNSLKGEKLNSILRNHYKCSPDVELTYLRNQELLLEAK